MRATLDTFKFTAAPPPAPFMVHGTVNASGNVTVTSQNDFSCGQLPAVYSTGSQNITNGGTASLQGNPGQVPNVAPATFENFTLINSDLDMLKALAKTKGTYRQGNQTFSAGNPLPSNGLIFIDTVSGTNPPCGPPCAPASDIPTGRSAPTPDRAAPAPFQAC